MEKVFLSHSSIDKRIVRKIKQKLTRVWTYFDEDCFEAGEDFRTAIVSRIENTDVFVLIASRNSLASAWVAFELDEIYWQKIKQRDIEIVVLSLDEINVSEFPQWMRRAKIEMVTSIEIAAQIIRKKLLKRLRVDDKVYVGRERDTLQVYQDINAMYDNFPNIIALTGLDGIGRRTFGTNIFAERFSLDFKVEFQLKDSEGIYELYQKVLNDSQDFLTIEEMKNELLSFRNVSKEKQCQEIARLLARYTEKRAYPVIVDDGAMLDYNGYYRNDFLDVLKKFSQDYRDCYLLLVHKRLPKLSPQDSGLIYQKRIKALDIDSCFTALDALLRRNNVAISSKEQVRELANHLDGYPPAIYYAVKECMLGNLDLVCNNKTALLDFQSGIFSDYLNTLPLDELDDSILELLNNLGSSSIDIFEKILKETRENIVNSLIKCCDYNIVTANDDGYYSIATPVNVAISKKYTILSKKRMAEIAHILIDVFNANKGEADIEYVNVMINAILKAEMDNEINQFKEYILPSNLMKIAQHANIHQEWKMAEKYVRKALELDKDMVDAKILLYKLLVRQENRRNLVTLEQQENKIYMELEEVFERRRYYLKGFRFWKRGEFRNAIEQFELAKKAGDDSIQVHRDLAECYFQIDSIEKAKNEIDLVLTPGRKIVNAFILDLAAKIAIGAEDFAYADEIMRRQELVDNPENINHRKATYYIKKKDFSTALHYANLACEGNKVLPQMYMLRMNIAIHKGDYDVVESDYQWLTKTYNWANNDLVEILYANMLLRRNGWRQAEACYNKIVKKDSAIAQSLYNKILQDKLVDKTLSIVEHERAEKQLAAINVAKVKDVLEMLQYYEMRKDNVQDTL